MQSQTKPTSTPKSSTLGKYRQIILSIALFLFFDLGVLTMNFYIATQIAEDAISVNLAGRQRMLSQRTVKTLLQIKTEQFAGENTKASLDEFTQAFNLFNGTLIAFRNGGTAVGGTGEFVQLPVVDTRTGIDILAKTDAIWGPYSQQLAPILNSAGQFTQQNLDSAIHFASANNLKLLNLMNQLTTELEQQASAKATRLRIIQTVGIFFALVFFVIIVFHFIRRLRDSDAELEVAREETEEILQTVSEGLFLLDNQMIIGLQHSKSLNTILARDDIAGLPLLELLSDLVPKKTLQTSQDYIELLFKEHVNERLITELNPLNEVEVYITDQQGGFETRYLEFGFKRVLNAGDEALHLLVSVNDITQRVALARQLEESQQKSQEQMDLLLKILHVEPGALKEFLQRTDQAFHEVNNVLRSGSGQRGEYHKALNQIFPIVHTIKGDASALELDFFVTKAHRFEDHISTLKERKNLTGNDLLSLTVRLDQLLDEVSVVRNLIEKLDNLKQAFDQTPTTQDPLGIGEIEHMVASLGEQHDKQVLMTHTGLEHIRFSEQRGAKLRDIFIQLARNSVAHGIEPSTVRAQTGKEPIGKIQLHCQQPDATSYQFTFRDDGRGISLKKLREVANRMGRWPVQEIADWTTNQLLKLIFESGFSTADEINDLAGRGVGMDIIAGNVQQLGGRIRVSSKTGSHCKWHITLPIEPEFLINTNAAVNA